MAQDIHALVKSLKYDRIRLVGHDIGLMVAYAYAAQYPSEVDRIVLMEAFLPGVGEWNNVFLLRDLWHFHFFGKTPLALVTGRERIYLEHFWNDFAADATKSVPRPIVNSMPRSMQARQHEGRDGGFPRIPAGRRRVCGPCEDQIVDADAGAVRRESRRSVPDRARQDGRDQCRGRAGAGTGTLADGGGA
jgi:pimeloyl-ACP methyl ester carboxylesterase